MRDLSNLLKVMKKSLRLHFCDASIMSDTYLLEVHGASKLEVFLKCFQ